MKSPLTRSPFADLRLNASFRDDGTPWYVDVYLAFGGWFAGLLAALAVFAFGFAAFSSAGVAIAWFAAALGLGFVFAGVRFGSGGRGAFRRHFSVAVVAAGLTAFDGGLGWVLIDALGGAEASPRRAGMALLGVGAAHAIVAILAARALKDRILTFLASLAFILIFAVAAALVVAGAAPSAPPIVMQTLALAAAAGAALVVVRRDRGGSTPGVAFLSAPIITGSIIAGAAGVFGANGAAAAAPFVTAALYAAGVLICLATLVRRVPAGALVAAGAVLLAFVWFLPDEGRAAALMLVAGMASGSRALAAVGVVATAWFVGRFYYDLSMTLLQKSALLGGLGLAAIALAEGARRIRGVAAARGPEARPRERRTPVAILAFGALLAAAALLVNRSVLQLDADFREARMIYLPLAPVDPRSLLQGDYMTLNFDRSIFPPEDAKLQRRGEAFLRLDARGVARFSRLADGADTPQADEIRVDYAHDGAKIRYCPDSFFFQEGEAEAFSVARFAALRVAADGKTRLVALADADLKIIDPRSATAAGR